MTPLATRTRRMGARGARHFHSIDGRDKNRSERNGVEA